MAVKDGLPSTDFSRMNREYIKAVAKGGSGGGGLPEITEADEGKVLTVESGEAAWATAGGGGGGSVLLITLSGTTLNKTGQEIANAFTSGSVCIVFTQTTNDGFTDTTYCVINEYLASVSEADGNYYAFICFSGETGTPMVTTYTCTDLSDYPAIQH